MASNAESSSSSTKRTRKNAGYYHEDSEDEFGISSFMDSTYHPPGEYQKKKKKKMSAKNELAQALPSKAIPALSRPTRGGVVLEDSRELTTRDARSGNVSASRGLIELAHVGVQAEFEALPDPMIQILREKIAELESRNNALELEKTSAEERHSEDKRQWEETKDALDAKVQELETEVADLKAAAREPAATPAAPMQQTPTPPAAELLPATPPTYHQTLSQTLTLNQFNAHARPAQMPQMTAQQAHTGQFGGPHTRNWQVNTHVPLHLQWPQNDPLAELNRQWAHCFPPMPNGGQPPFPTSFFH